MIHYTINFIPSTEEIIDLYQTSGINRPTNNYERINKMYTNSNLVITAWDSVKLVGIARALTDFCYCCYLSDLAVRNDYQKQGIGKKLIALVKEQISNESALILLSASNAINYYHKAGFEVVDNGFIIKRTN